MSLNLYKIIELDKSNQPVVPNIVLANRGGKHIGVIQNVSGFRHAVHLLDANEISFDITDTLDGIECELWDQIQNFMFVYIPRDEEWYEIYVSIDEDNKKVKHIEGMRAQQAELSQLSLNEIEINTEDDIARDDYVETVFYNPDNPKGSLLNRILADKAPHYSIYHVDDSLKNLVREFSFDKNTYITDALDEIAEEVTCLFVFGEHDGHDNEIHRTISAYDMSVVCNDCGTRNVLGDVCPNCGSTDLSPAYGEYNNLFISTENLTDRIAYSTNTDEVKNCFRLGGGDDQMTAAIENCNPSGDDYIWLFSDQMYSQMSDGLQSKLQDYAALSNSYETTHEYTIPQDAVTAYNNLITKYQTYDEDLEPITTPIVGHSALVEAMYKAIDFSSYLETSLLPEADAVEDTDAEEQAAKLTSASLSPIGVQKLENMSSFTADSAVVSYAKVYVDTSRYKVSVSTSTFNNPTWTGVLLVESYSDEDDTALTGNITITFNNDAQTYTKQLIDKALAKYEANQVGILQLFDMTLADFTVAIREYSRDGLMNLQSVAGACTGVLSSEGIGDSSSDLYETLYLPYHQKEVAIDDELALRIREIELIHSDTDPSALLNQVQELIIETNDALNMESYLGTDLWIEFCSFRRDTDYSNENFISDGLSSTEMIQRAREYYAAARRELDKAANAQHTVECDLYDLLLLDSDNAAVLEKFEVGNWLQLGVDDKVYRLRLTDYEIDYEDLSKIQVTFADFTDKTDLVSETASVLKSAKSMSTSFGAVMRQANKGEDANKALGLIRQRGFDLTAQKIVNNSTEQNLIIDENGLLARRYDDIDQQYLPGQLKVINDGIYYTNDNWDTVSAGLGRFIYTDPETDEDVEDYGVIAKTVVGKLFLGNKLTIYNSEGDSMDDAREVATNYLSADSTGVMVADQRNGVQTPSTATGKNVLIDSNSLDVRDGQDVLASFGTDTIIGKDDSANLLANSNGITLRDGTTELSRFTVDGVFLGENEAVAISPTGSTKYIWDQSYVGEYTVSSDDSQTMIDVTGDAMYDALSDGDQFWFGVVETGSTAILSVAFTKGTQENKNSLNFRFKYDGTGSVNIRPYSSSITSIQLYVRLRTTLYGGVFSFGANNTATGFFSATLGEGLTATQENQVVIGRYNQNNQQALFMIGNGENVDGEITRSNVLVVSPNGDMHHYGSRFITDGDCDFGDTLRKNGYKFIETESYDLGVVSITSGTPGTASPQNGNSVITTNVARSGYTPISVKIRYVNTSVIGFNSYFSTDNSTLYTQVIRRSTSAYAPGYHAYADVTYVKN